MEYVLKDESWQQKARELMECANMRKKYEEMEGRLKEELVALSNDENCSAGIFRFFKSFRKGSVEYEKIPELRFVDLDKYRKPGVSMWRLTLELEKQ